MPAAEPTAAPPDESGLAILDAPHSGRTVNITEYDPSLSADSANQGGALDISVDGGAHALAPGSSLQAKLHSEVY